MNLLKNILDHYDSNDYNIENSIDINGDCLSLSIKQKDKKGVVSKEKILQEFDVKTLILEYKSDKAALKKTEELFVKLGVDFS